MTLDVRLPIGAMFAIIGALLSVYGLLSDPAIYRKSLGININLTWGVVLLVFGLVMLFLGRRSSSPASDETSHERGPRQKKRHQH